MVEPLQTHLKDEDRPVRGDAAFVFAALGDERGLQAMGDILEDRSARLEARGTRRKLLPATSPQSIQTPGDKNPDRRVLAIYALEMLKARPALPELRLLIVDNEAFHFDGVETFAHPGRRSHIQAKRNALICLDSPMLTLVSRWH
jgi:HEAT repeat protein